MYKSATVKLTSWYLLILMSISLLFSIIIYRVADSEINTRLESLQQKIQHDPDINPIPGFDFRNLRASQAQEAAESLFVSLLYTNIIILVGGGVGSYLLARRTLQPIERSYEAQSRFTSDASHELRTPLAVMKTELEVALRDPTLTKDEMRELLDSNLEEVNKLTELSRMLLQLSRLDHTHLETERVALDDIVQAVVKRYDKEGTRIRYHKAPKPLFVSGNKVGVEELITILVDNAIKYSPADSVVDITVTKKDKHAAIAVKNKGEGIDAKNLPYIFDRFYRIDSSRTGGAKSGYGLGLSLAKKIVELHHGELSASSAKNEETIFRVLLPIFSRGEVKSDLSEKTEK